MSQERPGIYRVVHYASGTVNVQDGKDRRTRYGVAPINPALYVQATGDAVDELLVQQVRINVANELAALLNDGVKPGWFGDLHRESETFAVIQNTGVSILAVGPYVDVNPPYCRWKEDDSEAAQSKRARLMDAVFGIRSEQHA